MQDRTVTRNDSTHKATWNVEHALRHDSRLRHVWVSLSILNIWLK